MLVEVLAGMITGEGRVKDMLLTVGGLKLHIPDGLLMALQDALECWLEFARGNVPMLREIREALLSCATLEAALKDPCVGYPESTFDHRTVLEEFAGFIESKTVEIRQELAAMFG